MSVKKTNKIEKRNDLNEVRSTHMTLQQLRFFSLYMSRINARDETTRRVKFSLVEFQKIMGLGRLNIRNLKTAAHGLLSLIVDIPTRNGGLESFQLFKECKIDKDDNTEEWYIEVDAHDKALPLFFDFKEKYFVYEVGNVLRLNSSNQIRMYEILKQRQKLNQPVQIPLQDLRELLGIKDKYREFKAFKIWVLDKAQQEVERQTDIKFTYEKVMKGRKVIAIKFYISDNKEVLPQMSISEYIQSLKPVDAEEESDISDDFTSSRLTMDYTEALPPNLSSSEVEVLRGLAVSHIDQTCSLPETELRTYDYLMEKTRLLYAQKKKVPERNYFAWLRKAVDGDWK